MYARQGGWLGEERRRQRERTLVTRTKTHMRARARARSLSLSLLSLLSLSSLSLSLSLSLSHSLARSLSFSLVLSPPVLFCCLFLGPRSLDKQRRAYLQSHHTNRQPNGHRIDIPTEAPYDQRHESQTYTDRAEDSYRMQDHDRLLRI